MASKSNGNPVCPMCFESTAVVKIVGTCMHAFCTECLSNHFESLSPWGEVFACPTCRVECPLPGNGAEGLTDYRHIDDGNVGDVVGTSTECNEQVMPKSEEKTLDTNLELLECQSCRHLKSMAIPADNLCEKCGDFYLCSDCTRIHSKNKVTQNHVVIPLKSIKRRKESNCEKHNVLMKKYCCTCSVPVCHLCIMFEHGDHDVKKICKILHSMVDEVKCTATSQERLAKDLESLEKELKVLKSAALDMKDNLVNAIEDQAEKCIDQILKQKAAFKAQVGNDFKVVMDVSACLDEIPDLVNGLNEPVTKANRLLKIDLHPADIEKLSSIKKEMEISGPLAAVINGEGYWESYQKLCQNTPKFVPNTMHFNIGTLEEKNRKQRKLHLGQLIFEQKLVVDDKAKFIPCVANLGEEFYAVAHPTIDGNPSDAVDIYGFPGTFKQTLREHVSPVYDMAATPDGKLAVLSDGSIPGNSCCIRIFNPETGYVRSTQDFILRGQLSFDVNMRHQYVILSNDGGCQITVFAEDGSVKQTHMVDTDSHGFKNFSRVTCAGMHIFVMGEKGTAVYEIIKEQLVLVTSSEEIFSNCTVKDISATFHGELGLCYYINQTLRACFGRATLCKNVLSEWSYKYDIGGDILSRISVSDKYIVMSQGHTIRIYTSVD